MALSPINIVSGRILKVLSLNAIATLVKMLTSFVSIKVVAVLIGPTGIALLGQLNNFTSIFLAASTGVSIMVLRSILQKMLSHQAK